MLPSSVMGMSSTGNSARLSDGSLTDSEDIFMTIDNDSGSEFFAVEAPRAPVNDESSDDEKQISVDPISLQGSTIRQASFRLVSQPVVTPKKGSGRNAPMPLPPPKLKFVSSSLPSSASSSPQSGSGQLKNILKNHSDQSSHNLSRMKSAMDDSHLVNRESQRRRSRSLSEARPSNPADDFDLWLEKPNKSKGGINQRTQSVSRHSSKPPLGPSHEDRMKKSKNKDHNFPDQDGFKCGKLCLFLPRGKGKPVRSTSSASTHVSQVSQVSSVPEGPVISRTVSLERFECGSWSSDGLKEKGGESANLFFDLPMELLRCSVSDMQSPVSSAFVFDDDNDIGDGDHNIKETRIDKEQRGVLKSSPMTSCRKSQDSSRHVRFSTSSPMSYPSSPRSREEFDAFLEAQNT